MRKYTNNITVDCGLKIVDYCAKQDLEINMTHGNLLDNYEIDTEYKVKLKGIKQRRYIYLREIPKNMYESIYEITLSDKKLI